jgi:GTP-binding protein
VGKSSLINALVGANVARVSATPGKTRSLNVYQVGACYLVDLPGYGFASAPDQERRAWRRLMRGYLAHRRTLAGVVWLLDARHHPSADDLAMPALFAVSKVPVLAAVTKADKVPRGQWAGRLSSLGEALELDEEQMITVSARTGEGIRDLEAAIHQLGEEHAA